jgi:hypothetical protein
MTPSTSQGILNVCACAVAALMQIATTKSEVKFLNIIEPPL